MRKPVLQLTQTWTFTVAAGLEFLEFQHILDSPAFLDGLYSKPQTKLHSWKFHTELYPMRWIGDKHIMKFLLPAVDIMGSTWFVFSMPGPTCQKIWGASGNMTHTSNHDLKVAQKWIKLQHKFSPGIPTTFQQKKLLHGVQQILEKEFKHLLIINRQPLVQVSGFTELYQSKTKFYLPYSGKQLHR